MQICILPQTDNHASIPPLSFLQAICPSCHPTNSVKALKALNKVKNTKTTTVSHRHMKSRNILTWAAAWCGSGSWWRVSITPSPLADISLSRVDTSEWLRVSSDLDEVRNDEFLDAAVGTMWRDAAVLLMRSPWWSASSMSWRDLSSKLSANGELLCCWIRAGELTSAHHTSRSYYPKKCTTLIVLFSSCDQKLYIKFSGVMAGYCHF